MDASTTLVRGIKLSIARRDVRDRKKSPALQPIVRECRHVFPVLDRLGFQNAGFVYNHPDMERSKWIQHCERVDRLLRQVLQQGSPPFTPEENRHFQESLAANELGIAFDLLCWKFVETGHQISNDV